MKKNNIIKVCQYLNPYKNYCELKEKKLKYISGECINIYIDCMGCNDVDKALRELEEKIKKEFEPAFNDCIKIAQLIIKLFTRRKQRN